MPQRTKPDLNAGSLMARYHPGEPRRFFSPLDMAQITVNGITAVFHHVDLKPLASGKDTIAESNDKPVSFLCEGPFDAGSLAAETFNLPAGEWALWTPDTPGAIAILSPQERELLRAWVLGDLPGLSPRVRT